MAKPQDNDFSSDSEEDFDDIPDLEDIPDPAELLQVKIELPNDPNDNFVTEEFSDTNENGEVYKLCLFCSEVFGGLDMKNPVHRGAERAEIKIA